MNTSEEKTDSLKKESDEVSASHFALQIALQTMKERCQLLQHRLSAVEEENLQLRIKGQNCERSSCESKPASELSKLEERITQLTRQKSQLVDRITMVAKENNQLWTRLSRLTEANQNLGNHLSKISDTLNKHPVGDIPKITESSLVTDSGPQQSDSVDTKEESLEEISLKIIDTIRREKKVLEQQCEEMVELQTGAISVEECGFTLTANGDIANGIIEDTENSEDVMEEMRKLREKIRQEQKLLKDQQAGLKAAIASVSLISDKRCKCKGVLTEDDKNGISTSETSSRKMNSSMSTLPELQKQLKDVVEPPTETDFSGAINHHSSTTRNEDIFNTMDGYNDAIYKNFDDRICPLCSKYYSQRVPFEEFHQHVLSHFTDNDDEPDSLVANFEVIT